MTFRQLYQWGCQYLKEHQVVEYELDARYLLEDCFGFTRNDYLLQQDEPTDIEPRQKYQDWIVKRGTRIPWQYITQHVEFMGLDFFVNESVLIPRQDTECLIEEVLPLCANKSVLDMCTGSGCIALSLMKYGKPSQVTAVDISGKALEVARMNAAQLREDVIFIESDLFDKVEESYDIIVSNPPYIAAEEYRTLFPEVKDYEPRLALEADKEGFDFYYKISEQASQYLTENGWLCFEIGCTQGDKVKAIMETNGFTQVVVKKDLAGLDRIVVGMLEKASQRNGENNV